MHLWKSCSMTPPRLPLQNIIVVVVVIVDPDVMYRWRLEWRSTVWERSHNFFNDVTILGQENNTRCVGAPPLSFTPRSRLWASSTSSCTLTCVSFDHELRQCWRLNCAGFFSSSPEGSEQITGEMLTPPADAPLAGASRDSPTPILWRWPFAMAPGWMRTKIPYSVFMISPPSSSISLYSKTGLSCCSSERKHYFCILKVKFKENNKYVN